MQKISYIGDGTTTEFSFNFPFYENINVVVLKNNITATGYSVVGTSGGQDANIPFLGGKVVFENAPTVFDTITIQRHLSLNRVVDYQPLEKINPTILNQDMNYIIESLKDFEDKLKDFDSKYEQITNQDDVETLLDKIDGVSEELEDVSQQITNLGDVSTIRSNISSLQDSVSDLTTTTQSHTGSISTLDTRTIGMIDYVIETQIPTAENNYTWYRKYKSGWIEMGGDLGSITSGSNTWKAVTVTLPVEMANSNYFVVAGDAGIGNAGSSGTIIENCTTTSFKWSYFNSSSSAKCRWFVSGMVAA